MATGKKTDIEVKRTSSTTRSDNNEAAAKMGIEISQELLDEYR